MASSSSRVELTRSPIPGRRWLRCCLREPCAFRGIGRVDEGPAWVARRGDSKLEVARLAWMGWGFDDVDRDLPTFGRISPMLGSSSSGGQRSNGDFSVDLKLGRLGDFGEGLVEKLKDPKLTPSKRARAPINGTPTVSCLVDGCKSDLSTCREYHRRHKVCELHSKTPKVMVGGKEQRFCQQCSRFHLLVEFDEVKRSCRKRLDGHNRRRRKSPLECLSTGSGRFLSNYQGTNSLSFPGPQIYPTTTEGSRTTWKSDVKSMEDTMLYNLHQQPHLVDKQNLLILSSRYCNSGRKQFPFLHGDSNTIGSQTAPQASTRQLLVNAIASSEGDGGSQKILYDGFNQVLDADCAPSLLSSLPNQTLGIGLSHVMHADLIPQVNTLVPALHYNVPRQFSFTQDMEDESATGLVLVPKASSGNLKSQDIFQVGPDESCANEAPQTLTPVGCRFD